MMSHHDDQYVPFDYILQLEPIHDSESVNRSFK